MLKPSIDLEMNQPSGKIIQIGVVLGDLETGEVKARFNVLVEPYEPIDPFIVTLTGITDEMIARAGLPLHEAYRQLVEFLEENGPYERSPFGWGEAEWGNDSLVLKQQYEERYGEFEKAWPFCFSPRCHDVKTLFQLWADANGKKSKGGLSKSMARFRGDGLPFKGRAHDALVDAENTFVFGWHLYSFFKSQSPVPLRKPKEKGPRKSKHQIGLELAEKVRSLVEGMGFLNGTEVDDDGELWLTNSLGEREHLSYKKAGELLRAKK